MQDLENLLRNDIDPKTLKRLFVFEAGNKKYWGIKRPYLQEFLVFCFSYFKSVNIWSAGNEIYVKPLVKKLFKDLPEPNIVMTFSEIFNENGIIAKPLSTFYNKSPYFFNYANEKNTLFLDDLPQNFMFNEKNGIVIPKFQPHSKESHLSFLRREDQCLLQFKSWLSLDEVRFSEDVRKLKKDKIFLRSLSSYQKKIATQSKPEFH
jgi:hypothetical protein